MLSKYNGINVHPISINHIIFKFEIIMGFIKSMGCFESPHLFPTLLLILYTFLNHHVPLPVALHMRVILAILNPHQQFPTKLDIERKCKKKNLRKKPN